MCNKSGRQLHVLQRLKGSLDYSSRLSIYKSFNMSNFNCCPVVWMFTSKSSPSKLEGIHKRAIRFVLDDHTSDYVELRGNANVPDWPFVWGIHRSRWIPHTKVSGAELWCFLWSASEKKNGWVNNREAGGLRRHRGHNDVDVMYELRHVSIINRAKAQTTNHGLKSFKYYGAKIWNSLPNTCNLAISADDFKALIKSWDGPKCSCSVCLLFTWLYKFIATT